MKINKKIISILLIALGFFANFISCFVLLVPLILSTESTTSSVVGISISFSGIFLIIIGLVLYIKSRDEKR